MKTQNKQIAIMSAYVAHGVPSSSLKEMCRKMKISYPKLCKYLTGQTCQLVGKETYTYEHDILRFIKGLPVID